MKTAKLFTTGGSQAIRLPKEFRFEGKEVYIRREGNTVVLEPKTKRGWPKGFFELIRVSDPAFRRPDQGYLPPVRILD